VQLLGACSNFQSAGGTAARTQRMCIFRAISNFDFVNNNIANMVILMSQKNTRKFEQKDAAKQRSAIYSKTS
jgi:hypothetical protein